VLGCFAPHGRTEEQGLPVLPFVRLAVEGPGRRRDGEVRYCRTRRGEPQFGVIGEITDDRDSGFACHLLPPCSFLRGKDLKGELNYSATTFWSSGRMILVRMMVSLRPSWRSSSLAVAGSAVKFTTA